MNGDEYCEMLLLKCVRLIDHDMGKNTKIAMIQTILAIGIGIETSQGSH